MKKIKNAKMFAAGLVLGLLLAATGVFAAGAIASATFNTTSVVFDGVEMDLPLPIMSVITEDNPGFISNYMPVRGVLEAMGYTVEWDGPNDTIVITSREALQQRLAGHVTFGHNPGALDKQLAPPEDGEEFAIIHTNFGQIHLRLFPDIAPLAVENFVTHARNGFYDGLIFHRVIEDFMIQGGCPLGFGIGGESIWGMPFGDEVTTNLRHIRGALSMANSGPFTNGSQFFIVQNASLDHYTMLDKEDILQHQDMEIEAGYFVRDIWPTEFMEHYITHGGTPWLDFNHTVFGQVFYGMDVVDAIAATDAIGDRPVDDVIIERIEIVRK